MQKLSWEKLIEITTKTVTLIISFMILLRFGYVVHEFMLNPFHPPAILSHEIVKHVMTALILLEFLALTLKFFIDDVIDYNLIILTVMTATGRDLILLNATEYDPIKILTLGFIFSITIIGLYLLKK